MALATGTNTTLICTKNRQQWTLIFSGLQLANQLDSREGIVGVMVVDLVLCLLPLPMLLASNLMGFLAS